MNVGNSYIEKSNLNKLRMDWEESLVVISEKVVDGAIFVVLASKEKDIKDTELFLHR